MIPLAEGTFGPGGTRWFDLANRVTGAARRVLLWAPRSAGLLHLSEAGGLIAVDYPTEDA